MVAAEKNGQADLLKALNSAALESSRTITIEGYKNPYIFDVLAGEPGKNPVYLEGGNGADNLSGTIFNDLISGNGGNDTLFGLAGNDRLFGGEGRDRLDGGSGFDRLDGGNGDDTYIVDHLNDTIIELAEGGNDRAIVSVSYDFSGTQVEEIFVAQSVSGIVVHGNELANLMAGNNLSTELRGEGGADNLFGDSGLDTLMGGDGDDLLFGGQGADDLFGGAGADMFNLEPPLGGFDTIKDFSAAEGDFLYVDTGFFPGVTAGFDGTLNPEQFHIGGIAIEEDDRFLYQPLAGDLRFDPDGSGPLASQLIALILGGPTLTPQDFLVF